MRNIGDPRQQQLFNPFERIFSPLAYKTIKNGWQGYANTPDKGVIKGLSYIFGLKRPLWMQFIDYSKTNID